MKSGFGTEQPYLRQPGSRVKTRYVSLPLRARLTELDTLLFMAGGESKESDFSQLREDTFVSGKYHLTIPPTWLLYCLCLVKICCMLKKTQQTDGYLLCGSGNERRGSDYIRELARCRTSCYYHPKLKYSSKWPCDESLCPVDGRMVSNVLFGLLLVLASFRVVFELQIILIYTLTPTAHLMTLDHPDRQTPPTTLFLTSEFGLSNCRSVDSNHWSNVLILGSSLSRTTLPATPFLHCVVGQVVYVLR